MFTKKYFISSFIVIFILIAGIVFKVSAREKYNYYIHINSKGSFYNLYINGIEIEHRKSVKHEKITFPVNQSLVSDENKISISYMPLVDKLGNNKYVIGPKEDFYIDVSLERLSLKSRDKSNVSILSINYAMDSGAIISSEKTINGSERIYQDTGLASDKKIVIGEGKFYSSFTDPMNSFTVESSFFVSDDFPEFPWENGIEIQVDKNLRQKLRAAYIDLYNDIYNGKFDDVYNKLEPVWEHGSVSLHLGSAQKFVRDNNVKEKYTRVRSDGAILKPIQLSDNPSGDVIEVLGGGKLVRILPVPIEWEFPNTNKGRIAEVVFYMDQDGELKPGAVF